MIGGAHPTIMLDELIDNPNIDHIFLGKRKRPFLRRGCWAREKAPRDPGTPRPGQPAYPDHSLFIEVDQAGLSGHLARTPFVAELPPLSR